MLLDRTGYQSSQPHASTQSALSGLPKTQNWLLAGGRLASDLPCMIACGRQEAVKVAVSDDVASPKLGGKQSAGSPHTSQQVPQEIHHVWLHQARVSAGLRKKIIAARQHVRQHMHAARWLAKTCSN